MTVTAVRLLDAEGGIGNGAQRSYKLVYQVETDDKNDGPVTVRTASAGGTSIPDRLTSFSFGNDTDTGAILYRKRAKLVSREDTYTLWNVTCDYGTSEISFTGLEEDEVDDPLDKAAHWSGSYIQYTRPYTEDKDGFQLKNSAGDPFLDPAPHGDDSRLAIVVTKNFAALNVNVWATFRDAVNDVAHWGLAARKIKVQRIAFQEAFFEGSVYYPVTFEFHINDDTWDFKLLNAGYREKDANGNVRRIQDEFGHPVTRPFPLDADGEKLSQSDIDSDSETFSTFRVYPEKDFTLLGLPATLGAP